MVFQKNFVVVVTTSGKILREHDGIVTLPFGSDYSLKLKNLESRKALVSVSIDGEDVLDGKQLIIQPNTDTTLEGFMDGQAVRHQFRFIEKTQRISDYRGDRIDDGIIRVEYRFEKPTEPYITRSFVGPSYPGDTLRSFSGMKSDEGITVHGADTYQQFRQGSIGATGESHVITIKLSGSRNEERVTKPIHTKTRLPCSSCGLRVKSSAKFCPECGTRL